MVSSSTTSTSSSQAARWWCPVTATNAGTVSSSTYSLSPIIILVFAGMKPPDRGLCLDQLTQKLEGQVDKVARLRLPQRQPIREDESCTAVKTHGDVARLRDLRRSRQAGDRVDAAGAGGAGAPRGRPPHGAPSRPRSRKASPNSPCTTTP